MEEDVVEVVMETKSMLVAFDRFYDCGVILYFISKLPLVSWIKQWLNSFIMYNCGDDVYLGPRGFYDVVFAIVRTLYNFDGEGINPFL